MPILLEIPVDDAEGLAIAARNGADRIELCAALALGGLTPSRGLIRLAARLPALPVRAMIRPRAGDFCASDEVIDLMIADIETVGEAGLEGVVLGVLDQTGALDLPAMRRLIAAAGPLAVTLHRAFDLTADWRLALDQAVDLGIDCILTSGQAPSAPEGAARLAEIFAHAAGRITIMPGAGVSAQSLPALAGLPLRRIHASCGAELTQDAHLLRMGFAVPGQRRPDPARIRALRTALVALTAAGTQASLG